MPTQFVQRKKLGLAFSGASNRSVFYIGFLEVLAENNISINHIAATSSASIVAAAFATGTFHELKKIALEMDKEYLFSLIEKSWNGGIYHMEKVEDEISKFTLGKKLEEMRPFLSFIATDIDTGQEVVLSMGDAAKAACASCAVPGIFEPIQWSGRRLVDGGLVNFVPGKAASAYNSEVVVGVDLRGSRRHIFSKWEIGAKKTLNFLKRKPQFKSSSQMQNKLVRAMANNFYFAEYLENSEELQKSRRHNLFGILGRALDIAIETQAKLRKEGDTNAGCDLFIVPKMPKQSFFNKLFYKHFTDFKKSQVLYEEGRRVGQENLLQIKKLLS